MDGAYVMLLYSGGVVLIFAVFTLLTGTPGAGGRPWGCRPPSG